MMKTIACKFMLNTILYTLLTIAIVGLSSNVQAQEVQSDYEIQQNFKNTYKALTDSLMAAKNTEQISRLVSKIKKLEARYDEHADLLNHVLYPSTFEDEMASLKRRTVSTQHKLATIEQQDQKLGEFTERVSSYELRLDRLNSRTDSLELAMEQSVQSEAQLSGLVRQYRKSLEKRDELILSFIDSVMVVYHEMDLRPVENLETEGTQSQLGTDDNALKMIEGIAHENIAFLKSAPKLSTEDYLRMNAVQKEFENMWNKLGAEIAEIYVDENVEAAKKQVDEAISQWDSLISERTWTSLNNALEEEGIDLAEFSSRQEFYSRLNGFLDSSINSSKKKATEEGYKQYQKFRSFWTNQMKVNWSDYLVDGEMLSNAQIASIDQKIDEWALNAEPESNNLLVYLLGASVLAVVILGVMLAREKNNHKHS